MCDHSEYWSFIADCFLIQYGKVWIYCIVLTVISLSSFADTSLQLEARARSGSNMAGETKTVVVSAVFFFFKKYYGLSLHTPAPSGA